MNTLINNNYPKISAQQQQNIQCKVRFQNNNCNNIINDFASQNLPKMVKNNLKKFFLNYFFSKSGHNPFKWMETF